MLPDNGTDIIIPLAGAGEPLFVGPMTRSLLHRPAPKEILLGLRFLPGGSRPFLREEMDRLSDTILPLSALAPSPFAPLREEFARTRRIDRTLLAEALGSFRPDSAEDPLAAAAADLLVRSGGTLRIEELSRRLGVGRRTLERRFRRSLGKSPKRFARIERLNRFVRQGPRGEDAGFYDQSHLIREFKLLAGTTPGEFFRER